MQGKKDPLPADFKVAPNPHYEENDSERILSIARNICISTGDTSCQNEYQLKMTTWAGTYALVSDRNLPLKIIGFAPILPSPITQHETVFTVLKNMSYLVDSLDQAVLPFVVDEGVYQYVVDIYCHNPDIFKKLFPMLGTFHMAKNAMRCAGKYIRGFGVEDGLIEADIFGSKIVEQVLSGSHYYRSFFGICILEDAATQLKMEAFLKSHDQEQLSEDIESLQAMRKSLANKDSKAAKHNLKKLLQGKAAKLLDQVDKFTEKCKESSEICLFYENFIKIVQSIKCLIKSDREADFLLHINALGELLPIFTGGDGINY